MSTVKFVTVCLCLIAILIRVSSPSAAAAAAVVPDDVARTHIRGPKLTTSGTGNKTSKSANRVDPKRDCGEMESRSECGENLKCRWCRSDALDDMCFPKSEASRLPSQIFTCEF
ncbi:hypothetical protein ABFS83_13G092800 [Erythranthe nasuta]